MNNNYISIVNSKQKKCKNCNHLYFKNVNNIHDAFCCLDCKTSYLYINNEINQRLYKINPELLNISFIESELS